MYPKFCQNSNKMFAIVIFKMRSKATTTDAAVVVAAAMCIVIVVVSARCGKEDVLP